MTMSTNTEIQGVGGGGWSGMGGMGGGGLFPFLFGLLFGEGGLGGKRGQDDLKRSDFDAIVNNMQSATRDQMNSLENSLASKFSVLDNQMGQDKIQTQINSMKDLFVSMNNAKNLSDMQSFNSIEQSIAECCCKTQASFATLNGKIDTQTYALENSIEKASAVNLLAQERSQNTNLQEFTKLGFQAERNHCENIRHTSDEANLTRAKIDSIELEKIKDERDKLFVENSQMKQTATILHHPGYVEATPASAVAPSIDINIGNQISQLTSVVQALASKLNNIA